MSQSESSVDSTVTVPVRCVEVMSLVVDDGEKHESEEVDVEGVKDDIELMIQRVSECGDCIREVMMVLLELHKKYDK